MTKLYLVRHGETVDNKAQIMQGQTPGKLNMKGIEQARGSGKEMEGTPIDVLRISVISIAVYRPVKLSPAGIRCHHSLAQRARLGAILRVNSSLTCRRTRRIRRTT